MAVEKLSTEDHFENWCKEAKDLGILINYIRSPRSFVVYESIDVTYLEALKTKDKECSKVFMPSILYTADFKLIFPVDPIIRIHNLKESFGFENPSNFLLFYTTKNKKGNPIVYIDVKPPPNAVRYSSKLGSSREFPVKQRVLYSDKGIYINKVIPVGTKEGFYGKTFTPNSYYMTDGGTRVRSNKKDAYRKITVKEFINENRRSR